MSRLPSLETTVADLKQAAEALMDARQELNQLNPATKVIQEVSARLGEFCQRIDAFAIQNGRLAPRSEGRLDHLLKTLPTDRDILRGGGPHCNDVADAIEAVLISAAETRLANRRAKANIKPSLPDTVPTSRDQKPKDVLVTKIDKQPAVQPEPLLSGHPTYGKLTASEIIALLDERKAVMSLLSPIESLAGRIGVAPVEDTQAWFVSFAQKIRAWEVELEALRKEKTSAGQAIKVKDEEIRNLANQIGLLKEKISSLEQKAPESPRVPTEVKVPDADVDRFVGELIKTAESSLRKKLESQTDGKVATNSEASSRLEGPKSIELDFEGL